MSDREPYDRDSSGILFWLSESSLQNDTEIKYFQYFKKTYSQYLSTCRIIDSRNYREFLQQDINTALSNIEKCKNLLSILENTTPIQSILQRERKPNEVITLEFSKKILPDIPYNVLSSHSNNYLTEETIYYIEKEFFGINDSISPIKAEAKAKTERMAKVAEFRAQQLRKQNHNIRKPSKHSKSIFSKIKDCLISLKEKRKEREYQKKETEKGAKNLASLMVACRELIKIYEKDSISPSCADDLMHYVIDNMIAENIKEILQWDISSDELITVINKMFAHASFDLLASGKYHIYRGHLNEMTCSTNLMKVYKCSMFYAVEKNIISEKERKEQYDYLIECINRVG